MDVSNRHPHAFERNLILVNSGHGQVSVRVFLLTDGLIEIIL
jgi:hypothetical protein